MNDKRLNEDKSTKRQMKFFKVSLTVCGIMALWVFIRFHVKVKERDQDDTRLRLMYMPVLTMMLNSLQAYQVY